MKVLMGFSGGVDSAVGTYLLKEEGYDVDGAFMRNWDALANSDYLGNPTVNDPQCPQEKDYQDAKKAAERLGVKLLRVDFVKEYWDSVFSYFLSEYKHGRTPNPDVFCNKYIKFDSFLKFALDNGYEKIAMGHYAGKTQTEDGHVHIMKAKDRNKDQSYFLCFLSEKQVDSCLFPLSNITKPEVREIAHRLDLETVMDKKDSTGVCFIGERNFRQFLTNYFPATPGDIVEGKTGKVVGRHMGVLYYTIGQHKGLGIGGVSGEEEGKFFIYRKDVEHNILYVAHPSERYLLTSTSCTLSNVNLTTPKFAGAKRVGVKFRYRQTDQEAYLSLTEDGARLDYPQGVESVTPGQIAAIYDGDVCLGGGIIEKIYRGDERID